MCSAVPVCQRFVCPQSVSSWAVNEGAIYCQNGHHWFQWQKSFKLYSFSQDHWELFGDTFPSFPSITVKVLSGIGPTQEGLG